MRLLLVIPLIFMGCSMISGGKDRVQISSKGSVCGVSAIKGEVVGQVGGKGSCGIENAVRVSSVGGITLSQSSLMNCKTAQALNGWVTQSAIPTVGKRGGGLTSMRVVAHYACRTRNNKRGARLSEHAKGNAIDIAGFGLDNGKEITVLTDWGRGKDGKILRKLHKSACGPFGTVLGPRSDRHHRDHFHLDTASYRGGPYCK